MSKWFWLGLTAVIITAWFVIITLFSKDTSGKNSVQKLHDTVKKVEKSAPFRKKFAASDKLSGSLFVPYWRVDDIESLNDLDLPENISHDSFDYIIYFGISATEEGVNRADPGYSSLESFSQHIGSENVETLLTLRMLNEDINTVVLDNPTAQSQIIAETIEVAQTYGFDGIVLDFEHSVLPTQKTTDSITALIAKMSESVHTADMEFAMTIYGDTFYRVRPYDVKALAPQVDAFYVMTYDFHKSYGTPGPNFPLNDGSDSEDRRNATKQYGYSLHSLIDDMYGVGVTPDMLVFVFGMYGYDWMVDDQNRPLKPAEAVTINQAEARYDFADVIVDPVSSENTTSFIDDSGQKHVIWFENQRSALEKINYLMTEGVSKVGYWAWGYY